MVSLLNLTKDRRSNYMPSSLPERNKAPRRTPRHHDEFDQYSKPAVSMTMNSDGARRWAQLTKQNIGRSIAIVLTTMHILHQTEPGNHRWTFTDYRSFHSWNRQRTSANVLNQVRCRLRPGIVQEDIAGPSLGQESINAGVFSFVVA